MSAPGQDPATAGGRGLLRRARSRFLVGPEAVEAAELQTEAARSGATAVTACTAGKQVVVAGTIRSLTLRPRAGVPALEAELYDGSARILLIWLGRRQIRGIEPGRSLVAHGRTTRGRDSLVIYNPSYELRPTGSE
jgi:hypothetical protein